jgi:hypothetical protein
VLKKSFIVVHFAPVFFVSCFNVLFFCSIAFTVVAIRASSNEITEVIGAAFVEGCEMITCISLRSSAVVAGVVVSFEYRNSYLSPA